MYANGNGPLWIMGHVVDGGGGGDDDDDYGYIRRWQDDRTGWGGAGGVREKTVQRERAKTRMIVGMCAVLYIIQRRWRQLATADSAVDRAAGVVPHTNIDEISPELHHSTSTFVHARARLPHCAPGVIVVPVLCAPLMQLLGFAAARRRAGRECTDRLYYYHNSEEPSGKQQTVQRSRARIMPTHTVHGLW